MGTSRLDTVALRKEYPGTVALEGVTLSFEGGKIHALVGKNGAGKSTLVKIFSGAVKPTSGEIRIDGQGVTLRSPKDALRKGIAAVYQELSLVPELSVAENILMGRLPRFDGLRRQLVDWGTTFARAEELLMRLGLELDVRASVRSLNLARQQFVEIAKAMSYDPSVLILDEPTSALSYGEAERLFGILRHLASRGVVLLYVTHRLQELRQVADTVTVLRNGRHVGSVEIGEATPEALAQMMFGEVIQKASPPGAYTGTGTSLEVRGLSLKGRLHGVGFTLKRGEVLGIAGLLGSGRTELLKALSGAEPADSGTVILENQAVRPTSPAQMKSLGVVLAPENRKEEGLVQLLSTRLNLCLASMDRISRHGFTRRRLERPVVERCVRSLDIAVPDPEAPVSLLSGGNQQKVVIGKWLNAEPHVMLLDEPTRGIDVQAKRQMFEIIWDLSRRGISCVVVSSELEELLEVCHRILVMRGGAVVGEVFPQSTTLEQLFGMCLA
jgi:ribose transport system ATP-binding protein